MTVHVPKVTVVIVTYQSSETIESALSQLREAHAAGVAHVIVVDNRSQDGTADIVASSHPWVELVRNDANVGFGRGCNVGIQRATTPYVLLLNPDAVIRLDAMRTLVNFMEAHPAAGMCGPAVREQSGSMQHSGAMPTPCRIMLKPVLPGWASRGQRVVPQGDHPQRTTWICGSVLMLRRAALEQIGGFDPRFFLYFEETDLCRRFTQSGWEIWTNGQAVCEHVNAASAKKTEAPMIWGTISEHYFRSRYYYLVKHHGWIWANIAEFGEVCAMGLRCLMDLVRGRRYKYFSARLRSPMFRSPRETSEAM